MIALEHAQLTEHSVADGAAYSLPMSAHGFAGYERAAATDRAHFGHGAA